MWTRLRCYRIFLPVFNWRITRPEMISFILLLWNTDARRDYCRYSTDMAINRQYSLLHQVITREIFACGIQNLRKFCLWDLESRAVESEIQLKESGIPLTIGIQNPSSTVKDWNPVSGIRNSRRWNPGSKTVLYSLSRSDLYFTSIGLSLILLRT